MNKDQFDRLESQLEKIGNELRLASFGGASIDMDDANQRGGMEGLAMKLEDQLIELNATMAQINGSLGDLAASLSKLAGSGIDTFEQNR